MLIDVTGTSIIFFQNAYCRCRYRKGYTKNVIHVLDFCVLTISKHNYTLWHPFNIFAALTKSLASIIKKFKTYNLIFLYSSYNVVSDT